MNPSISTLLPRKLSLVILGICMSIPLSACSGGLEKVKMEDKPLEHPLPINTQPRILAIGSSFSIGIKEDGTVWSWGRNDCRQLGYATEEDYSDIPRQIPNVSDVIDIGAGIKNSFIVRRDGTVWGFGNSWNSMFSTESKNDKQELTQIKGLNNIKRISVGSELALAIDDVGRVWTWGAQSSQLGHDVEIHESRFPQPHVPAPLRLPAKAVDVVALSGGGIALLETGKVWSWGRNIEGLLGRDLKKNELSLIPKQITSLSRVYLIAGRSRQILALTKDNDLVAWGTSVHGPGFSAFTYDANVPVVVKRNIEASFLATNGISAAYVNSLGESWHWMYNRYGQFGNGGAKERPTRDEWVTPYKSLWTTR